jgi:hypothetical protein
LHRDIKIGEVPLEEVSLIGNPIGNFLMMSSHLYESNIHPDMVDGVQEGDGVEAAVFVAAVGQRTILTAI